MGPITSIFPVTRVVQLAGESFKVSEFRLRDLVRLQGFLDSLAPDPLLGISDELSGLVPFSEQWRQLVAGAYEIAECGPPAYGDPRANAYFGTPEGASVWLWVALKRKNRGITPAKAARLFLGATAAEYGHLWRVCHGTTPIAALTTMLMPRGSLGGKGGQGGRKTWPEMIDTLSRERNWTYDYICNLTIGQWIYARNHGAEPDLDMPVSRGKATKELAEAQRRRFYGEGEKRPPRGAAGAAADGSIIAQPGASIL